MIKMSYQKNIRLRSDPRLDAKWAHSVDIGKHIYLFLYIKVFTYVTDLTLMQAICLLAKDCQSFGMKWPWMEN